MKKQLCRAAALWCAVLLCACGGGTPAATTADTEPATTAPPVTEEVPTMRIATISELNTASRRGSHNGKTATSSLEADARSLFTFKNTEVSAMQAYYPRLKQMADGTYILFYQNGRWGPDIFYKTSADLVTWSTPRKLFTSGKDEWGDTRGYATADAAVLDNGDILVVCCYRTVENYSRKPDHNGLVMRRSTDNGKTWSEIKQIYVGTTWEPCVLQLASGEVQVYFTHPAPYIALYGYNSTIRSSGAAIIRSFDRGETYTPNVTGAPYEAYRVMQCYVGDLDGHKIMNDQMPVAIQLQNGNIAVACETNNFNVFNISLGYSYDNFAKPLGLTEVGPADRVTNFVGGVAPYLAQFESGETVLSYTRGMRLRLRVGNEKGKNFINEILPIGEAANGLWASVFVLDSHTLAFVTDNQPQPSDASVTSKITGGKAYLNHALTSKIMTPTLDGDSADWASNTDALFLGSDSDTQCCFRFARDAENLYLCCDRLDRYITTGDKLTLSLFGGSAGYYEITVNCKGVTGFAHVKGKEREKLDPATVACAVGTVGALGVEGGDENGWTAELAIPLSAIGYKDKLRFNATLTNSGADGKKTEDSFIQADASAPGTWFPIDFEE